MRKLAVAVATLALLAGASPSLAAPCRNAKGQFTKCPTAAAPKSTRCRDAKGHFTKCGLPGTHPA